MKTLTDISAFVVLHFKSNKLQRLVFKSDDKQSAKLAGIQSAIDSGYLTSKKHPLNNDYIIRATNKLKSLYKY